MRCRCGSLTACLVEIMAEEGLGLGGPWTCPSLRRFGSTDSRAVQTRPSEDGR
jgi:hypothetical protein